MKNYSNIPVELLVYALKNRKVNQLRLYLHLKLSSDGYITFSRQGKALWAEELQIDPKTLNSALEWLIRQRWITVNGKRGVLHIISYGRLSQKLKLRFTTGFAYDTGVHRDFRELICGVVISYYLRRKRYFKRRSGSAKGGPITNRIRGGEFTQMANGYLAKCLGVSIATAYRIKQLAEKAGYITTHYGYRYLSDTQGEKLSIEKGTGYRDFCREENGTDKIRQGKRHLVEVAADHICSHLSCKRKRCKIKNIQKQ